MGSNSQSPSYRLTGDTDDSGPLLPAVVPPSVSRQASLLQRPHTMDPVERRKALTAMGADQVSVLRSYCCRLYGCTGFGESSSRLMSQL